MGGLPSDHRIDQKGPRAHHFAAGVSVAVGLSFVVENASPSLTDAFQILGVEQMVWGWSFLLLGLLTFGSLTMVMRAVVLSLLTAVWGFFFGITAWGTWFGPRAASSTSFVAILSFAMTGVCVLACSNLKRDFVPLRARLLTKRNKPR